MRLSALAAAIALLSGALQPTAASAQRLRLAVVVEDFQADPDVPNRLVAGNQAGGWVRAELDRFASGFATLQYSSGRPNDRVAAISGSLGLWRSAPGMLTLSTIVIGRGRPGRFENVRGVIRPTGEGAPNLELFQLIVGYALLVRAWQQQIHRDRSLVLSVSGALRRHIDVYDNGLMRASSCWREISLALAEIEHKARFGPPDPDAVARANLAPASCR